MTQEGKAISGMEDLAEVVRGRTPEQVRAALGAPGGTRSR
jgi:hypothetical protein